MNNLNDASNAPMTLADVAAMLPSLYAQSSVKANRSALARVEKITGRRLHHVSADVATWQTLIADASWTGEFEAKTAAAAERNFKAWAKKIESIIRRAHAERTPAIQGTEDEAWAVFLDLVLACEKNRGNDGRPQLPASSHLKVEALRARFPDRRPASIDRDSAIEALHQCPPDKKAGLRRTVRWLNKRIAERDRLPSLTEHLPSRPIGELPALRDAPLKWSSLREGLLRDIEAAIRQAQKGAPTKRNPLDDRFGSDPVADRRTRKKNGGGKSDAPERAKTNIRGALSFLLRHIDASERMHFDSLETVLTPENIETAVDRFVERTRVEPGLKPASESTSLGGWLGTLKTLAKRSLRDSLPIEDAIFDLCIENDVALPGEAEMSQTREAFLRMLDRDPKIARAIIMAPEMLAIEARRAFASWDSLGTHARSEALHLCMAAAFTAMQLSRPLRPKNLNALSEAPDGAQLMRGDANRLPWLNIARSEVKNRTLLDNPISPRQWPIIELWLDEGREKWCAHRGIPPERPWIFPGETGGPISRGLFNKAWNRGFSRLGVAGQTPHMMRHVCVTLLLARRPGEYGVAADLIGAQPDTLRRFYTRNEGAAATRLFADILGEICPDIKLT